MPATVTCRRASPAGASSLAGHLGLSNLVVVYDDNHISIDGPTELSFTEDRAKRYEAYGWYVQKSLATATT